MGGSRRPLDALGEGRKADAVPAEEDGMYRYTQVILAMVKKNGYLWAGVLRSTDRPVWVPVVGVNDLSAPVRAVLLWRKG